MRQWIGMAGLIVLLGGHLVGHLSGVGEYAYATTPLMPVGEARTHGIPDGVMNLDAPCLNVRSTTDRPDDMDDFQVHLMYVLASDGVDEQLDTNGAMCRSIAAFNHWFVGQTGGRHLQIDTFEGLPDITFFRVSKTEAFIRDFATAGGAIVDGIGGETVIAGFNRPNKVYLFYFGGVSPGLCGQGGITGAAVYVKGCGPGTPTSSPAEPGIIEFVALHELLHALGFVPACAPNGFEGHVSDNTQDLMGGQQFPVLLDVGNDDYFMHNNPGCPDLAHNPVVALPLEDAPGLPVVPDANGVIYFNDFEATTAALTEWSIPLTDTTPIGARRFLGQFGNDGVVLTLRDLPVHTGITLSFDLFILQQWHGTKFEGLEEQGFVSFDVPDTWEVRVIDGPTLLQTTFSNHVDPTTRQSYPDFAPDGNYPSRTGAVENDALGYAFGDSVYHLSFTFPHTASSLLLRFAGFRTISYLPPRDTSSWGLDHVEVRIIEAGPVATLP